MSVCTFFGHRDCPESVKPALRGAIEELITDRGVNMFYVGNQGKFDTYAWRILQQLQREYPCIRYAVVLAYMPTRNFEYEDASDTVFPEGMEFVHPRYAIAQRNRWMLEQSDFVICYIAHHWGGAARYVRSAMARGKAVTNLFEAEKTNVSAP